MYTNCSGLIVLFKCVSENSQMIVQSAGTLTYANSINFSESI